MKKGDKVIIKGGFVKPGTIGTIVSRKDTRNNQPGYIVDAPNSADRPDGHVWVFGKNLKKVEMKNKSNVRYKYRVIFALEDADIARTLARRICKDISHYYGGCTHTEGSGYWSDDGAEDKNLYAEPVVEQCQIIEVVTTNEQTERVQQLVNHRFAQAHDIGIDDIKGQWIHLECIPISCAHFQVSLNV